MGVVDTTGEITPMLFKQANTMASYNFSLGSDGMTGGFNIVDCQLGSGTGAFSKDDYTLANDVTSSFGATTYTFSYSTTNHKLVRTMTFTRQNTSNSSVTVRQIGIIKVLKQLDSNSGDWANVLIAEFDITPVTVAAGETVTITVDWEDE